METKLRRLIDRTISFIKTKTALKFFSAVLVYGKQYIISMRIYLLSNHRHSVLIISFLLFLFLHSCSPPSRVTKNSYEKGLVSQPYDAIIVTGYPYKGQPWNAVLTIRIHWANYLYKKGYTKNIIFSGGAVYSEYIESKVMAIYAAALGIPSAHIFTEETAEHGTENVYYAYCLAKKNSWNNIALATDPYQTKHMKRFIRKYDLPVKLLPIVFDTLVMQNRDEPHIDASPAIKENFVSITKRQSLYYRLRGTFGKNIIWHEEDLKKKRFKRKYRKRIAKGKHSP